MPGYELDLYCQEHDQISLEALASLMNLHPEFVEALVELGVVSPARREQGLLIFDSSAVARLRTALRLRSSLGVNLAGVAVILDLLDKVCALQHENRVLRARQG